MKPSMSDLAESGHGQTELYPSDSQTAAPSAKTLRLMRTIDTMQSMEIEFFFGGENTEINFPTVSAQLPGLNKV